MKNFYGSIISCLIPTTLIFIVNTTIPVVAQQNEMKKLPFETTVKVESNEADNHLPIFKQSYSIEKYNLIEGHSLPNKNFPIFNQKYSKSTKQLSNTELNIKTEKNSLTSSTSISNNKDILSVTTMNPINAQELQTSKSPVGTPDQYVVPTDQVLSIAAPGFLANDIDLNGETITATAILDNVDNGSLAAFPNGSFTYTPNAGFTGTDQFSYQMRNASNNLSEPVTVTIEVLPAANRNPVGTPDTYAMIAGTTLLVNTPGFLTNDIDLDGETITATAILDNVDNGSLAAFPNGSFSYTPVEGFTGTDQFSYRMRDASNNQSEPVTVTIEVYAANRAPIGVDDQYTAVMNTTLMISAPGFLANDIDLDGEPITAIAIVDNVDSGSLAAFPNGSFTYTPDAGFIGTDQFLYRMRDASNNLSGPVTVTIVVSSAGTTPVGTPDQYVVPTDNVLSIAAPGFLANDIDLNGETLTATAIVDNVDNGSLAAFPNGNFTYTPNAGFIGTDQFSYQMRDASNNLSEPITVTIEVLPAANRNPVGTPDTYAMIAETTLSVNTPGFLTNDIDLDGETITATSILENVDNGSLAAFPNGSFTYTPNEGFTGTDQFSYRMRDASNNQSEPVTVTIEVYAANRAPIGVDDQYAAVMNTTLMINAPGFLANDIDLDGEPITATAILDNVDNGSLAAFPNGSFTYTPDAGFIGTDQFLYRMRDASNNLSEPVTVTLQVYLSNQKPIADAGEDQTHECDGSGLYTIILDGSKSSDPDNDPLIYSWRLNGNILTGPSTESTAEIQLGLGYYEIELTIEDIHGETDTDILIVSIEDTTAPTFSIPEDITIFKTKDCTYDASTSVTGDVTDESDNCDTSLDATYTDVAVPGECAGEEVLTRTWTLTDDSGNTTTHVQIITVEDQLAPAIHVPDDYIICMEPMPEYLTATWTDNCTTGGELTTTGEWYSETDCTTTYSYSFYVTDDCGNEAFETVYVTRETEVFSNCETAFAYLGNESVCFVEDGFKNWGWTSYFEPSETAYSMDLFAGSGKCDINKGYQAGTVEVSYINNEVTVTYNLFEGYVMHEAHVYVGCDKYPTNRGKETVAPGKYTYNAGNLHKTNNFSVTFTDVKGSIYIIAHATVCEVLCECTKTEYVSVLDDMYLGINCSEQTNEETASDNQRKGKKSVSHVDMKSAKLNVYPNPFSDKLYFEFTSYENVNATLEIYNSLGQKVKTLLDRNVRKGEVNTISFMPENQVSGIYIYHLKLNDNIQRGKVIYNPRN